MGKRTILLTGIVAALATALTLAPATGEAQVAKILKLQGRLLSQAGTPIPDGDYGVTLRFYKKQSDAKADALLVYIDPGVKVKNGLFAISVGENTKLDPKTFYSGDAAWLGLQVGSDDEMPRIALHYVAYALRADQAADLACSGCVSTDELDPKVLEPYAKSAALHKVATTGKYDDIEGTPDLTPYAKSAKLHKVAKTGQYSALEGKPPLAELSVCGPGKVLKGHKPDGSAVCVADTDTKYSGKDFAKSSQKCAAGKVIAAIGPLGKVVCVDDANDKYSGKDFALSGKKCAAGKVVAGIAADGTPVCVLDQKGESTGKDFALSGQKCPAGKVSMGVTADGKPLCVADKDTTYSGKDFALSGQKCPAGKVVGSIGSLGKVVCVDDKDTDTKYSGKNFAVSNQKCAAGQVMIGVDVNGLKICVTDANTKYTGKDFAQSGQQCPKGQVLTGIDVNGFKLCTAVGGNSHNHNYDVNDPWLSENGKNAPFKAHGGKYQVVMRTDGTGQYAAGIGDYPFVWMYGGDVSSNRRMLLAKDGTLWTSSYGWLHSRFAAANKSCTTGKVMKGVDGSGNPVCVTDKDTATVYKAGTGLTLASNTFSLNVSYADSRYVNEGQSNAITSAMIKNGQVGSADVADNSLTTTDIKNGTLTGGDIAVGTITGSNIKDSTIGSVDVADGSLKGADIAVGTITGSNIKDGTVTSADVTNGSLTYSDTNVDSIQRRVTGTCPAGQAIRVISKTGTVTCATEVGSAATKYSASVVKGNWYRIASTNGGAEVAATFTISESTYDSSMQFRVGISSGYEGGLSFTLLHHSRYTTKVFDKIRVVEAGTGNYQYLDVKFAQSASVWLHVRDNLHQDKWKPQAPKIIGTSDGVSGYNVRIFNVDKLFAVGDTSERLSVTRAGGVAVSNGAAKVTLANSAGYGAYINTGAGNTSGKYILDARNTSGPALFVRADRRVGINTSSPAEALHVNGNIRGAQTGGALRVQTSSGYLDIGPQNSTHAHFVTDRGSFYFNKELRVDTGLIGSYNENLHLRTSGTTRMSLLTNGNVGIATTSPGRRLHVNGTTRLQGQVGLNGDIRTGYGINAYGSMHMNNSDVNYVNQLHFNDNLRFYDEGNDSYLNFKYGDGGAGGVRFYDGNNTRQGTLYSDGHPTYPSFGLLDADNNWGVRVYDDQYTSLYRNGAERLRADAAGVKIYGGELHMNNGSVNYVTQLHFNDNLRFYDENNDSYLNFKYGDGGAGGVRFYDGNNTRQGTLYSDGHPTFPSFGLLDADNNWGVRVYDDQYTSLYQNGGEKLRAHGGGVNVYGTLDANSWIYAGGGEGLRWKANLWGGSGDEAYIQYYRESGENTKLRILNNNDADDDIEFYQAGAARMNIYNGNVGIGYTTPDWKLKVNGNAFFSSNMRQDRSSGAWLQLNRADSSIYPGDLLGAIGFDGTDGNVPTDPHQSSSAILAYANEYHGTGDKGGRLEFWVSPTNQNDNTNGERRMRIDGNGWIYTYRNQQLGDTYDDRTRVALWRTYDYSNQNDQVYLDRYQVVLTYSQLKKGRALDMNRIRDYCDDYDGCQVVIGMIDWYSSGYHGEMAHYTFRFHYDWSSGRFRVGDSGPWGGNNGDDGDSKEYTIANAYSACLFEDFDRSGNTNYNDGSKSLYFTYWTQYSSATYKNKKCVITFMD